MSTRHWLAFAVGAAALLSLALIFWGWRQGGLALLQLGMSIC